MKFEVGYRVAWFNDPTDIGVIAEIDKYGDCRINWENLESNDFIHSKLFTLIDDYSDFKERIKERMGV